MSGIYIRGMEMPKGNHEIIIRIQSDGRVLDQYGHRLNLEPTAVHVPPHGDLIDYEFCMKNYELLHDDDGNPVYAVRMRDINSAPTIIPAEEE